MTYFSEGAVKLTQEVIVRHLFRIIIEVVDSEEKFLDLLKVVVHLKRLGELRTEIVIDAFSAPQLHTGIK
jgi:hypothetical protein